MNNLRQIDYKDLQFIAWDLGGQPHSRRFVKYYFSTAKGIIFVIDSNDQNRLQEAKDELNDLLSQEELKDAWLIVVANKQDLPDALSPSELSEFLELSNQTERNWKIEGT